MLAANIISKGLVIEPGSGISLLNGLGQVYQSAGDTAWAMALWAFALIFLSTWTIVEGIRYRYVGTEERITIEKEWSVVRVILSFLASTATLLGFIGTVTAGADALKDLPSLTGSGDVVNAVNDVSVKLAVSYVATQYGLYLGLIGLGCLAIGHSLIKNAESASRSPEILALRNAIESLHGPLQEINENLRNLIESGYRQQPNGEESQDVWKQ